MLHASPLGRARILHMPGELFVEYQLAAKAERPDLFIAMAAYGDYGPGYICTAVAYEQGGYEAGPASNVSPEAEDILMKTIRRLLSSSLKTLSATEIPILPVSGLKASARDGQVFLTWNEAETTEGTTFNVYVAKKPIVDISKSKMRRSSHRTPQCKGLVGGPCLLYQRCTCWQTGRFPHREWRTTSQSQGRSVRIYLA